MLYFLNIMMFRVRVLVLFEKMYFIYIKIGESNLLIRGIQRDKIIIYLYRICIYNLICVLNEMENKVYVYVYCFLNIDSQSLQQLFVDF